MDEDEKLTKKEKRELAKQRKQEEQNKKQMTSGLKKFFVWFFAACLVVFVGYKGYSWVITPTPGVNGTSTSVEVNDSDWIRGNYEAPVTLVEFGDFECPACANYYPLIKKLEESFPDNLRVVYKQYPLVSIHKNALGAAKATEAAGKQGKFWEMHDMLYEKHDEWAEIRSPNSKFEEFAELLGLDLDKFKSDIDSDDVSGLVNEDINTGRGLVINSTPTFYLNGEKIQPSSYDQFKSLVDEQVKGYKVEE